MAYSALVSLAQILEKFLPNQQDYTCFCDKQQFESLHSNVTFLQKLLADFSGNRSSAINQLESRITDVAYHAYDIIACEISDSTSRPVFGGNDAREFSLKDMFLTFGSCIQDFNSIVKDALEIKKSPMDIGALVGRFQATGISSARTVVGLEDDLTKIKERVVGQTSTRQIIPIVGMGGIGKTTLARKVYEDQWIVDHFDIRCWVTVSQEYDENTILQRVLDDQKVQSDEHVVGDLILRVHQRLIGRRYIVVMDDMWHAEVWDKIRRAFPDDNNGSCMILTTRLLDVAAKVGSSSRLHSSSHPHQMQLLSKDHSWVLFQEEVYGQQGCPPELENIGKVISGKCKGLPLAIAVTARLLKVNITRDYWEKFARNINEATTSTSDDQLFGILSLSYDNLPAHLKACFLYMSLFPEDYAIPSKTLIRLWSAEGFVEPRRDKSVEEVAEEYLVDLIERNLLFVARKGSNGRIRSCSIHDVLRELSIRKAHEEKFLHHTARRYKDKETMSTIVYESRCRRIRVTGYNTIHFLTNDTAYKTIHSFLIFFHPENQFLPFFGMFRLLRVLDALYILFDKNMAGEVFSLVNLRYLALSIQCDILIFWRQSVDVFENLETLIIKHRPQMGDCTRSFLRISNQLPKLRNFIFTVGPFRSSSRSYLLYGYPYFISLVPNSNSLRTLSGVINMSFTADTIERLQNLVELKAEYSNFYRSLEKFCLHNLVHLHQLEKLTLTASVPMSIAFPNSLKKLTLTHFIILPEQMSIISSLPNLEVLKLIECTFESNEWDPVEGGFPLLKYLKLKQAQNLKVWNVERSHFPRLEQLIITGCDDLKEVPAEVGDISTLKKLALENCKDHLVTSARIIQEEQEDYGNDGLEILVGHEKSKKRQSSSSYCFSR